MVLKGLDGDTELEVSILRYEFPDITNNEWDSNWLIVKVGAKIPGLSWSGKARCMLIWESHWLLNWLVDLASGVESDGGMCFMEPNLKFEVAGRRKGMVELRIGVQESLMPPSARLQNADQFDFQMEVTPSAVEAAARDLHRELSAFPARAGVKRRCRPYNDSREGCALCKGPVRWLDRLTGK